MGELQANLIKFVFHHINFSKFSLFSKFSMHLQKKYPSYKVKGNFGKRRSGIILLSQIPYLAKFERLSQKLAMEK